MDRQLKNVGKQLFLYEGTNDAKTETAGEVNEQMRKGCARLLERTGSVCFL